MRLGNTAIFISLCTFSFVTNAQQFNDAAEIEVGSFEFIPTIDVGFRYDDNVTRAPDNEISSLTQIISPQFLLVNNFGVSQARFGYRIRDENFYSSSPDNYTDHFVTAGVDYEYNIRNRFDLAFNFEDGHEQRGTGFSILNLPNSPDRFKETNLNFLYSYGAPSSTGRLEFNADFKNRDYDNDDFIAFERDRIFYDVGATFFYRIGTATDLTFDAMVRDVEYNESELTTNTLNSVRTSFLVGLDWAATAKTTGFAKIGYEEKDFDSDLREDFDGFDWALGVNWEPTENAKIRLVTNNNTDETNGEGNFILRRDYQVEWRHNWLDRFRTSMSYIYAKERFEGDLIGIGQRDDDLEKFNITLYYQFRRWLNFDIGYTYDSRDSNRDFIDYDRNQFLINVLITL